MRLIVLFTFFMWDPEWNFNTELNLYVLRQSCQGYIFSYVPGRIHLFTSWFFFLLYEDEKSTICILIVLLKKLNILCIASLWIVACPEVGYLDDWMAILVLNIRTLTFLVSMVAASNIHFDNNQISSRWGQQISLQKWDKSLHTPLVCRTHVFFKYATQNLQN